MHMHTNAYECMPRYKGAEFMAELKAGGRLKSAVCATEVIAVKAPGEDLDICCGGVPMVAPGTDATGEAKEGFAEGTALGKRYVNADDTLEVLCTKAGDGSLSIGDAILEIKDAKQLPASD